jgi:photosystem II stability/assembly factor-like uncharacterized protein
MLKVLGRSARAASNEAERGAQSLWNAASLRWALLVAPLVAALAAPSACTFYTGCPDKPAATASGNGGTTSGHGGSGGTTAPGATAGENGEGGNAEPALGAWQDATGSLKGRTSACGVLFVSGHPYQDELIAGLDQFGLWANTEGSVWSQLGTSKESALISNGVSCIVYDPEDPNQFWEAGIYVGFGGYRTSDGGKTFVQLGDLFHVDSISVDFTDPKRRTLIAGPHEKGQLIYKSTDAGMTWVSLDNLPDGTGASSYVLVRDADTYLVGCTNSIIRTTDGGDSWTVVSQLGGMRTPLVASDGSIYWNADARQGLVRSSDGGETFERIVGGGFLESTVSPLELPDGRLAAVSGDQVVVSADQGFSWATVGEAAPHIIKSFTYLPARKAFYASTDSCNMAIPRNAIIKLDFDYETN